MMTKPQIRQTIKEQRKHLTDQEVNETSLEITRQILKLELFEQAEVVFLYAAFETEVQTIYLDEQARIKGKKVAYPKIELKTGAMDFYATPHFSELQPSSFRSMKILEPSPLQHRQIIPGPKDIVIVPAVAFDNQGNRVGYGGGFYDRYLSRYPYIYKIGICMAFQLTEAIEAEFFDIKMDCVLTEKGYHLPF
ncbi:MAG: putative 5-formyltetrahydrofolate cyclo-ligase [Clostridia bacterium]|nr:putative 5-formyltetrahydrofolate cyclo-ligase [Clostridia bacterium]